MMQDATHRGGIKPLSGEGGRLGCAVVGIRRFATNGVYMFSLAFRMAAISAVLVGACLSLTGQGGQQVPTISHIAVNGDNHDLDVEITATAPITPLVQTTTDPDRLIVDIPEVQPSSGLHRILVNRRKVRDIRVGLFRANPPIARVVLDLAARTTQYTVSPLGNTIVIRLGNESRKSGGESKSAPAPTAPTVNPSEDARPGESPSVVASTPRDQSSAPSRARWILPILFMVTIAAMLVCALVAHIQNKRTPRGI